MDQLCAACGTPAAPIPPRCCRPMPFWGTMPEPTRCRPPWACCPCLAKAVWRSRCAQLALGRTARALCWHRPRFTAQYLPVRRFLAMALGLAKQRCASYHIWAALPLTPTPDGEELCAQYLASGLTLRAVVPLDSQQLLVFAAHPRWAAAARCAAYTCRTPPCRAFLERAAAPWQILAGINRALSSACGEWNKETDACRRFL